MMQPLPNVLRGCGRRTKGGVYLESGIAHGGGGRPLEWFLVDPPRPFEVAHKVGVELVTGPDGKTHVVDWIGQQHYGHAADFLEEGRRFGFSRRVHRGLDFSRLELGSRMLFVHAHGDLANLADLLAYFPESLHAVGLLGASSTRHHCGKYMQSGDRRHFEPFTTSMCTRYLWAFPESTEARETPAGIRWMRRFNEFEYEVHPIQPDAPEPEWRPALIASIPIVNVNVVRSTDGGHVETLAAIREALRGRLNSSESDG